MSNLIKIIGTGKSRHMPEGVVYYEPADMAELFVFTGRAVYEEKDLEKYKEDQELERLIKEEKEKKEIDNQKEKNDQAGLPIVDIQNQETRK
jgi:hypothetical protein